MTTQIKIPNDIKQGQHSRSLGKSGKKEFLGGGFLHKPKSGIDLGDYNPIFYSLCYLIRGSGLYVTDSGQELELRPGDFFQRIPGYRHTTIVGNENEWHECFIDLGPGLAKSLVTMGIIDPAQPVGHVGLIQTWVDTFAQIIRDVQNFSEPELPLLLPRMLDLQCNILAQSRFNIRPDIKSMVDKACELMRRDIDRRISLREMCEKNAWGYEKFRKAFTETIGISPKQYRIRCRIDAARHMLMANPEIQISEISCQLGYANPYEFSVQFKAMTGSTPARYRHHR